MKVIQMFIDERNQKNRLIESRRNRFLLQSITIIRKSREKITLQVGSAKWEPENAGQGTAANDECVAR